MYLAMNVYMYVWMDMGIGKYVCSVFIYVNRSRFFIERMIGTVVCIFIEAPFCNKICIVSGVPKRAA